MVGRCVTRSDRRYPQDAEPGSRNTVDIRYVASPMSLLRIDDYVLKRRRAAGRRSAARSTAVATATTTTIAVARPPRASVG